MSDKDIFNATGYERDERAMFIASNAHEGQRMMFGPRVGEDYFKSHVLPVAERVQRDHGMEARLVALLHDVLEDTWVTEDNLRKLFPDHIVRAVVLLTRPGTMTYRMSIERIAAAGGIAGQLARWVKIADIMDHVRDMQPNHTLFKRYQWAAGVLRLVDQGDRPPRREQ